MPNNKIIFVYNADSGFFNTVSDIAHKITSPETYQCELCALTHGYFTIKNQWKKFIESTEEEFEFYHRDEFVKLYGQQDEPLPAVFRQAKNRLEVLINKYQLQSLQDIQQLIDLIKSKAPG